MIKETLIQKTSSTERLLLEKFSIGHNSFVFELLNSEEWKRYIGDRSINNIDDAINYIHKILDTPDTIYWVINKKDNNKPIGIVTLIKRVNFDFYDLGFALLKDYSGHGFAFEASTEIIKIIQKETNLEVIKAITLPTNSRSIQLLERLNMTLEGDIIKKEELQLLYNLNLKQ